MKTRSLPSMMISWRAVTPSSVKSKSSIRSGRRRALMIPGGSLPDDLTLGNNVASLIQRTGGAEAVPYTGDVRVGLFDGSNVPIDRLLREASGPEQGGLQC